MILDIGCGTNKHPGAIGVDIRPLPGVDVLSDILNLPFLYESVDTIFMKHVIEHFPRQEQLYILSDIYTILKPGGKLFLYTPNMVAMCKSYYDMYVTGNFSEIEKLTYNFVGGGDYLYNHHFFCWNIPDMAKALMSVAHWKVIGINTPTDQHEMALECVK